MDATWAIAMLVVGLIFSIVAATEEGTVNTVLFTGGFLLLAGSVMLSATALRR